MSEAGSQARRGHGGPRDRVVEAASEQALASAAELLELAHPVRVESWISGLISTWRATSVADAEPEAVLGDGLVRAARADGGPAAMALLLGLVAVAPAAVAEPAADAVAALRSRGVAEPCWAASVGRARFTSAWRSGDLYGDQHMVVVGFAYPDGGEHSLGVLVDHNHGGMARDAFVAGPPAEVTAIWREHLADGQAMACEALDASTAGEQLRTALTATDRDDHAPVSDDFAATRALAWARVATLPHARRATAPAVDRDALIADFLAAPERDALASDATTAFIAGCLVDFRCEAGDGLPLRWSPTQVALCLLDWFPHHVTADGATVAWVPAVLEAWVAYAGRRTGLAADHVETACAEVRYLEGAFFDAVEGVAQLGPPTPSAGLGQSPAAVSLPAVEPVGFAAVYRERLRAGAQSGAS
jgi:hypothetical protein